MSKDYFKLIPAVYLFLRKENEVLLLRRANTGYQDGKYSVIAGHLDGGELATEAMCREAKEEAGIIVKKEYLKFVHVTHRLNDSLNNERVDFFFEAWKWDGEITNMEPEKCDDLTWYPIDKLPVDIIPHVKLVLEQEISGVRYSEYSIEP